MQDRGALVTHGLSPPGVLLGGQNTEDRIALGAVDNYGWLAKNVNARGVGQEISLAVRTLRHCGTPFQ